MIANNGKNTAVEQDTSTWTNKKLQMQLTDNGFGGIQGGELGR